MVLLMSGVSKRWELLDVVVRFLFFGTGSLLSESRVNAVSNGGCNSRMGSNRFVHILAVNGAVGCEELLVRLGIGIGSDGV